MRRQRLEGVVPELVLHLVDHAQPAEQLVDRIVGAHQHLHLDMGVAALFEGAEGVDARERVSLGRHE